MLFLKIYTYMKVYAMGRLPSGGFVRARYAVGGVALPSSGRAILRQLLLQLWRVVVKGPCMEGGRGGAWRPASAAVALRP